MRLKTIHKVVLVKGGAITQEKNFNELADEGWVLRAYTGTTAVFTKVVNE